MDSSLNIFVNKLLTTAAKRQASTIHLTVSSYPTLRIAGELVELNEETIITGELVKKLSEAWLDESQLKNLEEKRQLIIVKELAKQLRVRISFFYQKGFLSCALQLIPDHITPLATLGLPKSVYGLTDKRSGLIIVAGPYGSGRTTTVAAMIDEINKSRKENILIVEQPIECLIANQQSIVEQREVGRDTNTFVDALRYALDADVDVISIGLNNEPGVVPLVLEFANSGRLAILTMETNSSVHTIEEIISALPSNERTRAQLMLSTSLQAIIVQRLAQKIGGGLVVAAEVLIANEAVRSLIADGRTKQLTTIIQSSRAEGMISLDQSLAQLVKAGEVLIDQAVELSLDPDSFRAMAKS